MEQWPKSDRRFSSSWDGLACAGGREVCGGNLMEPTDGCVGDYGRFERNTRNFVSRSSRASATNTRERHVIDGVLAGRGGSTGTSESWGCQKLRTR